MLSDGPQDFGLAQIGPPAVRSQSVRRFAAILIGMLLLAHAVVPALPRYVCVGMDGAHRLHPCCPEKPAELQDVMSSWERARCCQPEQAVAIDAQQLPRSEQPRVLAAVTQAGNDALPAVVAVPPVAAFGLIAARGDPAFVRPPPRLHFALHVLRI
jgi:hypothetical protein